MPDEIPPAPEERAKPLKREDENLAESENERVKRQQSPATPETFRTAKERGVGGDAASVTLLQAISESLGAFMSVYSEEELSQRHRWNIIALSTVLDNAMEVLSGGDGPGDSPVAEMKLEPHQAADALRMLRDLAPPDKRAKLDEAIKQAEEHAARQKETPGE